MGNKVDMVMVKMVRMMAAVVAIGEDMDRVGEKVTGMEG